jgi:hypothetical protein
MSQANPRYRRNNPHLPPVPANSSVVEIKMIGAIEGQLTVNTFYYVAPVIPSALTLGSLLSQWTSTFFTAYAACVSADWSCTKVRADVVSRNDIAGTDNTSTSGSPGTRPAGHEPTQMGIVVIRVSNVKGQHGRGRYTFPAVSSGDVTNSTITSNPLKTSLTAFQTALFNTVSDGVNNWSPVIAERSPTTPRLVIGTAPLTNQHTNLILGTIRRRKIGKGR